MNLLDKEVLSDPIGAIKKVVSYSNKSGMKASYETIRAAFYSSYLAIDAKSGSDYAATFALATSMSSEEQETLRYEWAEREEKIDQREADFQKDPLWCGKEATDFVIVIQKYEEGKALDDDAKVISSRNIHFNINDFMKSMFLYVSRSQHGFVCKKADFNQDSNVFHGTLRIFF